MGEIRELRMVFTFYRVIKKREKEGEQKRRRKRKGRRSTLLQLARPKMYALWTFIEKVKQL